MSVLVRFRARSGERVHPSPVAESITGALRAHGITHTVASGDQRHLRLLDDDYVCTLRLGDHGGTVLMDFQSTDQDSAISLLQLLVAGISAVTDWSWQINVLAPDPDQEPADGETVSVAALS